MFNPEYVHFFIFILFSKDFILKRHFSSVVGFKHGKHDKHDIDNIDTTWITKDHCFPPRDCHIKSIEVSTDKHLMTTSLAIILPGVVGFHPPRIQISPCGPATCLGGTLKRRVQLLPALKARVFEDYFHAISRSATHKSGYLSV